MKDGSTLSGIAALIGSLVALATFIVGATRGKSWLHALRSNLDLVAERDALAALTKLLTAETMTLKHSADGWEQVSKSQDKKLAQVMEEIAELKSRSQHQDAYIRTLYAHAVAMEKRSRDAGLITDDLRLPPLPKDLDIDMS